MFGNDEWADETFMAYYVGRFMGEVAKAGKAELNMPMYANAWLGPQPPQDLPGESPSDGPAARVMDVYRAAAPSLDLIAPDIYPLAHPRPSIRRRRSLCSSKSWSRDEEYSGLRERPMQPARRRVALTPWRACAMAATRQGSW